MKKIRNISALLFVLVMMIALMSTASFAANPSTVTFATVIDTPEIEYSETEDQEVTVTITVNEGVVEIDGIGGTVLEYKTFDTNVYHDEFDFDGSYNPTRGKFGWDCLDDADYVEIETVMHITYVIPAGTPVGEYTLGIKSLKLTYNGGFATLVSKVTASATLTIKEAAPACDHVGKTYTYESNDNNTHKVTCECGEVVAATENHDYENGACSKCSRTCDHDNDVADWTDLGKLPNDDGNTHSEWALCDCGTQFRVGFTNECTVNNADGDCTTAEICECGRVMTPASNGHVAEADDGDCTTAVKCANCDQIVIEAKEHGTVDGFRYDYNNNGTHTKYCDDCNTAIEGEINVPCSGGTNTCTGSAQCDDCKAYYGSVDANNHPANRVEWKFDNEEHWQYCKDCENEVANSRHAHDYQYNAAYRCNRCSECGHMAAHNINWDANGGTLASGMTSSANYGSTVGVNVSKNPTRDGYAFTGWTINGKPVALNGSYYEFTMPNEDVTVVAQWECTHDETVHEHTYTDNRDGTHTVMCACGETIDKAEEHDYTTGDADHTCACGKVEEFTLTVNVRATGKKVDLTVPYGTNVLEVLAQAAEDGKIPAIGDKIRYKNVSYNGNTRTIGYSYWVEETYEWIYDLEGLTMPAADFAVDQDHEFYNGWIFYYDENYVYVGAEFLSKEDYLTGWNYIEEDYDDVEGGAWYYFAEGTDGWGGYFFRAEGLTRVPYPTEKINGVTYAPNDEDMDYAANKGRVFIDATEAWFVFADNGKFQSGFTGLTVHPAIEGALCYAENGMIVWHPGFVPVGSELYYFVGDKENGGNIWANGDVIVSRLNGAAGFVNLGTYNFVDGRLNKLNGVYPSANGKLYYYINGWRQVKLGLAKLGEGKYIYVRSNGELAVGEYYIPANDLGVVSTLYTFDENGYMVNPKYTNVNGIVDGYYYVNGKIVYGAGLIEVEGAIYYVRSSGKVATGEYYITNTNGMAGFQKGMKLTFGEDGKLQTKDTDFGSIINGYYYVDGKIAYGAGVVKMEDETGVFYIYVKANGQLATGKYWPTTLNGELAAGEYDWGTDGKYYPAG